MQINNKDIAYVTNRYAQLFQRIAELSDGAKPPGRNAANGWFREHLLTDSQIHKCGRVPIDDGVNLKPSSDADHLFQCYLTFEKKTYDAFLHHDNAYGDIRIRIVWNSLPDLIDAIAAVSEKIISAATGNLEGLAQAAASAKSSIDALVKDVDAKGLVYHGRHMNGWLASSMAAVAIRDTLVPLDKHFPAGTNSDAGRITEILRKTMRAIEAQNSRSFDPWLDAEWQIAFQSAMSAGAVALKAMSN
ncbi:MAG TPA: hypothetical protein VFT88_06690 [Acidobacteriaceae bacterium]|nr:hypothetical protein [Acidobacteriaceae bacterium]